MSSISNLAQADQIRLMPKTELHVHLEGSIRPETVLKLAKKNGIDLPADSVEGLRHWYKFRDFPHFVEVYVGVTKCIKDPADLEFIGREFLQGQADQNIVRTEATYTASTVAKYCGIPIDEQMDALKRALDWGTKELGILCEFVLDVVRGNSPEEALETVEWVTRYLGNGVCALGIAGFEKSGTKQYAEVFAEAIRRSLPVTAHAGETEGPWSIWETLEVTGASRIGHGVTALSDPLLIEHLVKEGIVLEVCPSSNVCLGGFPTLSEHPIQKLRDDGVRVTINSDDPPMFGTTLTDEMIRCSEVFGWEMEDIEELQANAKDAAFVDLRTSVGPA